MLSFACIVRMCGRYVLSDAKHCKAWAGNSARMPWEGACLCTCTCSKPCQGETPDSLVYCTCRLVSYVHPARNKDLLDQLQQKKMTVLGEQRACMPTG